MDLQKKEKKGNKKGFVDHWSYDLSIADGPGLEVKSLGRR